MHLTNALGVVENFDAEGIHNIIVNVLQVVLVDATVLSLYAYPQLEPYILLKVDAIIHSKLCMSVIPRGICLGPSPQILHG